MTICEAVKSAFIARLKKATEKAEKVNKPLTDDQIRVFERGVWAFSRFDEIDIEAGLNKFFKGYTPEELYAIVANDIEPSADSKELYLEAKDFDYLIRLSAYVGGAKAPKKVKGLRSYKTFLPIPLETFLNALVEELRVYDKTYTQIYCGKLIGSKFYLEDIKDVLFNAGVKDFTAEASSIKTLLRFCGLIDVEAYNRQDVMQVNPEGVRMIRKAIVNHNKTK